MRIFKLVRTPPQWLRVALAGLMLAFALNSIAHVTHRHDASPVSAAHTVACSYCVSFGGLADAPRHAHGLAPAEPVAAPTWLAPVVTVALRTHTSARPRAPPAS